MSNYISYIGPYIKFEELPDNSFDVEESDDYWEVGHTHNNYRYLISLDEFFMDDVDTMREKEITPEEISQAIARFTKVSERFVANFKQSFGVDLVVLYGAIFYEA